MDLSVCGLWRCCRQEGGRVVDLVGLVTTAVLGPLKVLVRVRQLLGWDLNLTVARVADYGVNLFLQTTMNAWVSTLLGLSPPTGNYLPFTLNRCIVSLVGLVPHFRQSLVGWSFAWWVVLVRMISIHPPIYKG